MVAYHGLGVYFPVSLWRVMCSKNRDLALSKEKERENESDRDNRSLCPRFNPKLPTICCLSSMTPSSSVCFPSQSINKDSFREPPGHLKDCCSGGITCPSFKRPFLLLFEKTSNLISSQVLSTGRKQTGNPIFRTAIFPH